MPHYKFGDLVFHVTDKRMPVPGDERSYVGLEHLDSGSLSVTRWGSKVQLKGEKLMMEKGDILFGRRNTYLRRAAMAPHDGLFSAHGMIFRPKTEKIDANYFPFFISSDYFMDAAIRISVGSLSPTVNWKTLKELEFDLPDMAVQKKRAALLMAANSTKESYQQLLTQTDALVKSQFIEMFGDPIANPMKWNTLPLQELGHCKNGMNFRSKDCGVEINCLGVGDFQNLSKIEGTTGLPKVSLNQMPSKEYLLSDGDFVFVRSNGNKALVGRCLVVYPHGNPTTFSGFCIRFRKTSDCIGTEYLLHYLKTDSVRGKMTGRGANIQNLNQKILVTLQVPIPPIALQDQFASFMKQSETTRTHLAQAINSARGLIRSIMRQNFNC